MQRYSLVRQTRHFFFHFTWIVCESLAWPRISNSTGSETKKNLGKTRRFFSKYLQREKSCFNKFANVTTLTKATKSLPTILSSDWKQNIHFNFHKWHNWFEALLNLSERKKVFLQEPLKSLTQSNIALEISTELSVQPSITTYPLSDFWQSSSCSKRCGNSCPRVSSPTQHCTTLAFSWARVMIFTHCLSMFWNRFASWK